MIFQEHIFSECSKTSMSSIFLIINPNSIIFGFSHPPGLYFGRVKFQKIWSNNYRGVRINPPLIETGLFSPKFPESSKQGYFFSQNFPKSRNGVIFFQKNRKSWKRGYFFSPAAQKEPPLVSDAQNFGPPKSWFYKGKRPNLGSKTSKFSGRRRRPEKIDILDLQNRDF